jgi:allantoinase
MEEEMTLPPGRFGYWPIPERPKLEWPDGSRVAFWVAPNVEHYEYTPLQRPDAPDIPDYAVKDYGNRAGFWRMYDVLNNYDIRATACLNLATLEHFPEVKQAMIDADWVYMAHGVYNTRPIYGYTVEQERAYWQDFLETVEKHTGKRVKGRLGGGGGYTENTDDLMAEAGLLYHTSWIIDDQPLPLKVKGGERFCYVPYTGQVNDAGVLAIREADYFCEMIKRQFDTLYREGAESGRVMCISLHPYRIGRPDAARYLDEALDYVLSHEGVWNTTADDIAEYYLANYHDDHVRLIDEFNAPQG